MNDFKGRHFRGEIVLWAVRWYCRYAVKLPRPRSDDDRARRRGRPLRRIARRAVFASHSTGWEGSIWGIPADTICFARLDCISDWNCDLQASRAGGRVHGSDRPVCAERRGAYAGPWPGAAIRGRRALGPAAGGVRDAARDQGGGCGKPTRPANESWRFKKPLLTGRWPCLRPGCRSRGSILHSNLEWAPGVGQLHAAVLTGLRGCSSSKRFGAQVSERRV